MSKENNFENDTMEITNGMNAEIIVLSADAINTDSKDGNISGMSVFYTFNTNFESVYNSPQSFGQKPGKIWMNYNRIEKIVSAPAKYIGTFEMKIGSDGKPVLRLKDLDYICDVKLDCIELPDFKDDPKYPKYAPAPSSAPGSSSTTEKAKK